jgi:hypothetical protein
MMAFMAAAPARTLQEDRQSDGSRPLNVLNGINALTSPSKSFLKKNLLAEVQPRSDVGADEPPHTQDHEGQAPISLA